MTKACSEGKELAGGESLFFFFCFDWAALESAERGLIDARLDRDSNKDEKRWRPEPLSTDQQLGVLGLECYRWQCNRYARQEE